MAMDEKRRQRQREFWVATAEAPAAPLHLLCSKLNCLLVTRGFDEFVEVLWPEASSRTLKRRRSGPCWCRRCDHICHPDATCPVIVLPSVAREKSRLASPVKVTASAMSSPLKRSEPNVPSPTAGIFAPV